MAKKTNRKPAGGRSDQRTVPFRIAPAVEEAMDAYNAAQTPDDRLNTQTMLEKALRRFLREKGFRPADEPEPRS